MFGCSSQLSLPSSPTYEAGVVEFNYERDAPITQASRTAANIACSAKFYQRYVVVGVVTKISCPDEDMVEQDDARDCTDRPDTMSYYNTNVVFDRNGTVVSRYRKFNLYGEDVDRPSKPLLAIFETDFGVKFGHFICFDILFRYPSLELIRRENITDIIYPTMWYSQMPFLTAVQVEHSWAFIYDVNMLAAGANNPLVGSTGTGIFAGRKGSLIAVMEAINTTNLYTATVPKIGLGSDITITETLIQRPREEVATLALNYEMLENYTAQFLNIPSPVGQTYRSDLCHGEYCCSFVYGFEKPSPQELSFNYAAVVYHGTQQMDDSGYGITVCAVIACVTQDIATCGLRNESLSFDRDWHKLEIRHNGDTNSVSYSGDNPTTSHFLQSKYTIREFYTFGLYGRDFSLDGKTIGGTRSTRDSFIFVIAVVVVTIV